MTLGGDRAYNVELTLKNGKKYYFSIEDQEEFCENLSQLLENTEYQKGIKVMSWFIKIFSSILAVFIFSSSAEIPAYSPIDKDNMLTSFTVISDAHLEEIGRAHV